MAWMYILECIDGSYYVGSTKDIERRLSQHQEGLSAKYTLRRLPVKLVYYEEYDRVDDAFYALLMLDFDDIRPEEWTPSYAGSASRTDFLLKREQLIIDIHRYKSHPDCKTLICFVYDPDGRIANPRGIENDLNREYDGVDVKVTIAPSGI